MRIERKYLAHFIQIGEKYVRLGEDLEEFSPELSANVEKHSNILGEKRVIISDYEKTASVEPYYAQEGDVLYNFLQDAIDESYVMEDLKVHVVDVKMWITEDNKIFPAVEEEAYVEVTSYGGDHNGYRIGFKLHYTGVKKPGQFNIAEQYFEELGA